jgi:hypothetical protein
MVQLPIYLFSKIVSHAKRYNVRKQTIEGGSVAEIDTAATLFCNRITWFVSVIWLQSSTCNTGITLSITAATTGQQLNNSLLHRWDGRQFDDSITEVSL